MHWILVFILPPASLRRWARGVRLFRYNLSPKEVKIVLFYPVINYASYTPRQLYIKKITFWSSNPPVFLVYNIVLFRFNSTLFMKTNQKTHATIFHKWLILSIIKEINRSSKSNCFHTFFKVLCYILGYPPLSIKKN